MIAYGIDRLINFTSAHIGKKQQRTARKENMADEHEFSYKKIAFSRFLSLMAVIIICLLIEPFLVSNDKGRYLQDVLLTIVTYASDVLGFITLVVAFLYIRRKGKFHREQTVFWPTRCHHCARVLDPERGLRRADSGIVSSVQRNNETVSSPESPGLISHFIREECRSSTLSTSITDILVTPRVNETAQNNSSLSSNQFSGNNDILQNSCTKYRYQSQNRPLITVFWVFVFIYTIGLIIEIIRHFSCYAHGKYSAMITISFTTSSAEILVAFPVILVFVEGFNDAIFLDSYKNRGVIALMLFIAIWKCMELMLPFGKLLNSHQGFNETNKETLVNYKACYLNDTLGDIFRHFDHVTKPIYTEIWLIVFAIVFQFWNSFAPKTSITIESDPLERESCTLDLSFQWQNRLLFNLKRCFRRTQQSCCLARRENEPLLPAPSSSRVSKIFSVIWTSFLMSNIPYLGLCLYFVYDPHTFRTSTEFHVTDSFFVLWSFETVFDVSLCILFTYRNIKMKKFANRSVRRSSDPVLRTKLKGHEIMLLVCSYGIFCQSIFLLTAAAGSLITNHGLAAEKRFSCIIAVVHSTVKVLMVWQMTGFLISIPRQKCDRLFDVPDKKISSVCLITVIVVSGTQWLIASIEHKTFLLEKLYFGDNSGEAIGILLEPFETIFELHAAMVAYELYKEL